MHKLKVKGRLIIPVRLIPYITGRDFAPDDIVKILAQRDDWYRVSLRSFSLTPGPETHVQELLPRDWDPVLVDLDTLTRSLKANERVPDENYAAWRIESLKKIPPGTYVRKSDFRRAHRQYSAHVELLHMRKGDLSLNYSAFVEPGAEALVYAGFEDQIQATSQTSQENNLQFSNQAQENEFEGKKLLRKREKNRHKIELRNQQMRILATHYRNEFPDLNEIQIAKMMIKEGVCPGLKLDTVRRYIRREG